MTVTGTSGAGDRVKDGGDNIVECDVRLVRGSTTDYNVSLKFQGGVVGVGNFIASGTVPAPATPDTTSTGNMDVVFTTGQFALQQDRCSVAIKRLLPGAIWVSNLHCDNLRDPSSPNIACDGLGGVIFENCGH